MKKLLLPAILFVAGIGFIIFPFFLPAGDIDLKIQPASVIMPAAYKVYANPDVMGGRYNLFKAIIKNPGSSEIKNLKVQYRIPGIIDDWTDVSAATDLLPRPNCCCHLFPGFSAKALLQEIHRQKKKRILGLLTEVKVTRRKEMNLSPLMLPSVNDIVFTNMSDEDKAYINDLG